MSCCKNVQQTVLKHIFTLKKHDQSFQPIYMALYSDFDLNVLINSDQNFKISKLGGQLDG